MIFRGTTQTFGASLKWRVLTFGGLILAWAGEREKKIMKGSCIEISTERKHFKGKTGSNLKVYSKFIISRVRGG